uniref:tetratricopeptide repeat protein n=1 Tax=Agathobacter sp. TaxID=2021311 RepID=UPI0040577D0D
MGRYFSDVVDKAIEDIYYCYDKDRAALAMQALTEAASAGDGDASYILSRCLSGPQYSWDYHPFPEDDKAVSQLIWQSIFQGSAAGVLGAMRCGMLTPEMEEAMPFDSLKQAWEVILEKAQAGSLFCQNMIGNTYFWLDIIRIQNTGPEDFPSREAYITYLRENTEACIPWFEQAFRGGMGFAGRNLYNLYLKGEEGLLPARPEKAREVAKLGAGLGYPEWEETYGGNYLLKEQGHEYEGLTLCKRAAGKGQLSAWYYVGRAYQDGKIIPKDVPYALSCYEKGLADTNAVGCANRAGELYFLGKDGIPQDYARAVQLFERAHAQKNTWGNDMLGVCCLLGYGCRKDPARALELFREVDYSTDLINYGLGLIYAEGMGVPEDIKKGVEYLQKAQSYGPAQEALLKYKRTLFGKWIRR